MIPPDEIVGLNALSRLARGFEAAVFLAVTFFAGAFFAGAFFAGAFFTDALAAAVFVCLTDACLLERVLVVTGFFAPVEAAFFFAAGLAFADVFLGAGCFDALAAD